MALWEIRVANQPPVRVEVGEERHLSEEYSAFEAYHDSLRWKFWRRASPYWQVTDDVLIHKDVVIGVLPRKPKDVKPPIGF